MEIVKSTSNMDFGVILKLSEKEARALSALTDYGTDAFLEVFYKRMGTVSLKPNEEGLISLFDTVKKELPKHFHKFDAIRDIWLDKKK